MHHRQEQCTCNLIKEGFLYTEIINTVGGLPIGSSDSVLCLFSGGIDSPVAASQMIKRGCKVDFLFMNIMGEKLLNDVARVYNFLITNYAFGYTPKLFIVNEAGKPLSTM